MLGTSPNGEGVVYHAAAPIYWRIALRLNSPCANILALRVLRVKQHVEKFSKIYSLTRTETDCDKSSRTIIAC